MSIYRHAKPCGFGCISLIPSRTKPDRFGYIRLIPTGAQPTGLDTPYLQSLNALTIDKATTGAVTADNTRSPKDTGTNPDAIAISSSLVVQLFDALLIL